MTDDQGTPTTDQHEGTGDEVAGDDAILSLPETPTYELQQFPEKLAVVKLPPGAEIPEWAESSSLFSITATATETSLVCAGRNVPTKQVAHKGMTAFAVMGQLDLSLTGVLAGLLVPLAEAEISVFTISTYDTDWILVPVARAEDAAEAWRRRGHTVNLAVPVTKPPRKSKK
ncbi:ACT domain-containing protein [Nocardioides lijunqiniae]|uniref:ACT domain-containing protein n=1 Tax=Nocardioides lijunqiniae TaxID=2760832 RepID=UPI001877D3AA|nr:ACT domain-containing protein [Nocardioides lijunqiniae]